MLLDGYNPGARDSEKYINPNLKKVSVTVNGSPNRLYNKGFEKMDIWEEAKRYFGANARPRATQHINVEKFYTDNKFCLLIDLRSMEDHAMDGSGTCLVNTKDGVQLELELDASGSGKVYCYVFVMSDSQMNIMGQPLESVQY